MSERRSVTSGLDNWIRLVTYRIWRRPSYRQSGRPPSLTSDRSG
jgi:hypothetical protein